MLIFLRDTIDPQRDLERGFSCHIDGWVDTEAEAWKRRSDAITDPKQDIHTGKWCADPELGLSSFACWDNKTYKKAIENLFSNSKDFAVFVSNDYDLKSGADGEDVFRNGTFIGWANYDTRWADVKLMVDKATLPF